MPFGAPQPEDMGLLGAVPAGQGRGDAAARFQRSQARRLGEIDPEPVAATLVAAGHFGGGVAELLLHIALVDLGRGGEAGAQRMAGEFFLPLALGEVAAHPGGKRGVLDQTGDVPVGQPLGADLAAADATEHRPDRDPRKFEPGLQRNDGAGGVRRAAADLDLAPAGLAAQRQQQSVVKKFDPAAAKAILGAAIEADDFRAPEAAGEADQEDRAVAQAAQIAEIKRGDHGEQILGQDGLLLLGRAPLGAADPRQYGGDVAVFAVHRLAALRKIPHERRQPPLDGADRTGFGPAAPEAQAAM